MRRPRPRRRRQYYRFSWAKPYVIRLKHFHGCNFRFRLGFRIQGGLAVHHVLLFPPFFMLAHSIEFNKNIYVPRYFAKSLRNKIHTSQKNTLKSQGKKQNNIQDSDLSRIALKLDHWCSRGYKFIAILLKNMYWLSDSIYILLKNLSPNRLLFSASFYSQQWQRRQDATWRERDSGIVRDNHTGI